MLPSRPMNQRKSARRSPPPASPARLDGWRRAPLGRRELLAAFLAVPLAACRRNGAPAPTPPPVNIPPLPADALLTDLERRAFDFFWETTDPATGLTLDRWPTPSFSSIAAVGFALTPYVAGAQPGVTTPEQARAPALA